MIFTHKLMINKTKYNLSHRSQHLSLSNINQILKPPPIKLRLAILSIRVNEHQLMSSQTYITSQLPSPCSIMFSIHSISYSSSWLASTPLNCFSSSSKPCSYLFMSVTIEILQMWTNFNSSSMSYNLIHLPFYWQSALRTYAVNYLNFSSSLLYMLSSGELYFWKLDLFKFFSTYSMLYFPVFVLLPFFSLTFNDSLKFLNPKFIDFKPSGCFCSKKLSK